jgi:hypothetical protein
MEKKSSETDGETESQRDRDVEGEKAGMEGRHIKTEGQRDAEMK